MSYKILDLSSDVRPLQTSINEVINVSSSIFVNDLNVKFYKNIASSSAAIDLGGYWQTICDSSPTSSLSTGLYDITYGYSTGSTYNVAATTTSSQTEKIKMYRQYASVLLGDPEGIFSVNSTSQKEAFFIHFKRNIHKDEIRKGTTSLIFNNAATTQLTATDGGADSAFKQTVGGDYAPLKYNGTGSEIAQIWYNAGVIVVPTSLAYPTSITISGSKTLVELQYSGTINQLCDGLRKKMERVDIHNQTNLYSTVVFCRAYNDEFNYSSNPTFVDANKRIIVTSGSNILTTSTYITTLGLYDANDVLLAVGKVNKPLKKSFDNEVTLRGRVDVS
jgi:hypothetical protein